MTQTPEAPSLGELLEDAPSNWGKWGPDDEVAQGSGSPVNPVAIK